MLLSDLLLYVLIVGVVILFNHLAQQSAKRKREAQAARQRAREAAAAADQASAHASRRQPAPPVSTTSEDASRYEWGRHPQAPGTMRPDPEPPSATPWIAPESGRAHHARPGGTRPQPRAARRLFASRQDLRRAVVVMAVLGPCRALEPPQPHDAIKPP